MEGVEYMIKIIACDLDETLLNHERKVDRQNQEAIRSLKEKGVKFVCASGRGFMSMQKTLEEVGTKDQIGEYTISFNGGAITENKNNRILYFQGLSFDQADFLFKRGLAYDVCIHVYTIDTVYVYRLTEDERNYVAGRMEVTPFDQDNIDFLRGQDIVKVLYVNTDQAYLHKIASDLSDISGDLDVSYSSNRYLEFNKKGVNKGMGLITLAKLLNVGIESTMAIGDNFNDLSMLKVAGTSVGVQNCVDGIKPDCDYITKADCDHGAVAEAIETFVK